MRPLRPIIAMISALFLLSGCGDSHLERAGNGAMIGMATGALVGGVAGGNPPKTLFGGALIGALIGGVLGALSPGPVFFNTTTDIKKSSGRV
ncbi:MAG: cell envelope biogenesis protein OmpA [Alphaproteobacteria bacterium]